MIKEEKKVASDAIKKIVNKTHFIASEGTN